MGFIDARHPTSSLRVPGFLAHACLSCSLCRSSMSGLHLVKRGREQRKVDQQRDFTVASPAEFVTRFGGNRVIEKVQMGSWDSGWGWVVWEDQLQAGTHAAERRQALAKCYVPDFLRFSPSWQPEAADACLTPFHRGGA